MELLPSPEALRQAQLHLIVATVADPVRGSIVLDAVAEAAGLPKRTLRKQIEARARLCRSGNLPKLYARAPRETTRELCRMMLT
jgi:hypothetical protein